MKTKIKLSLSLCIFFILTQKVQASENPVHENLLKTILIKNQKSHTFCFKTPLTEDSKKAIILNKKSNPTSVLLGYCATIAVNQVHMLNDMAYSLLWECLDGGFSNCGAQYNSYTAAGMEWILNQADDCEGVGHL